MAIPAAASLSLKVVTKFQESQAGIYRAMAKCGWLTAVTAVVWLILVAPAWGLAGRNGIEGLSYAALLCLVPGWLVFLIGSRYGVAETQGAFVVLSGTALRLVFVLSGTLFIQSVRKELRFREFIVWLLVFYLVTLLFETLQGLKQQKSPQNPERIEQS